MDWPTFVRRYVWDSEKTPYLVRAETLTPAQARHELFSYSFLLGVLAVLVAALSLGGGGAGLLAVPLAGPYALTVAGAAAILGATRHPTAAAYCATAPLALALAVAAGALRPGTVPGEALVLGAFATLWFLYALRIVGVARRARDG